MGFPPAVGAMAAVSVDGRPRRPGHHDHGAHGDLTAGLR